MQLVVLDVRKPCGYFDHVSDSLPCKFLQLRAPEDVFARERECDELADKELADIARAQLREFVPLLYADLPRKKDNQGRSLVEYVFRERAFLWWFTSISEKSIFRGELIKRLYKIALIRLVIDKYTPDKVIIETEDALFADCLEDGFSEQGNVTVVCSGRQYRPAKTLVRSLVMSLGTVLEYVLQKLIFIGLSKPKRETGRTFSLAFFSFFPSWWKMPWSAAERKETFFQDLTDTFSSHGSYSTTFLTWLSGDFKELIRNSARLRKCAREGQILFLQHAGKWGTAFSRDCLIALASPFRVLKLPLETVEAKFCGVNISRLIKDELLDGIGGRDLTRNYLLYQSARNVMVPDALVFRMEFQPYERALILGLEGVKSFGFQHSSIGKDYLSHVFLPQEIRQLDEYSKTPIVVPDHILCTGPYPAKLMVESGFPSERVHVCGAVRYPALRKLLLEGKKAPLKHQFGTGGRVRMLVLVSLDREEALQFAAAFARSINCIADKCKIDLKAHPSKDHAVDFARRVRQECPEIQFNIVDPKSNLYEHITASDCVVMTGSTVGIEAMALGVPVVCYVNCNQFSYTAASILAVKDAIELVWDVKSLTYALERLVEEELPFLEKRDGWRHAVQEMFGDICGQVPSKVFVDTLSLQMSKIS